MSTSKGGLNAHLGAEKAFAPFGQVFGEGRIAGEKLAVMERNVKE